MASVLAEFSAYLVLETADSASPVDGRVTLSEDELVFDTDDTRESVPLEQILDINYDTVPLFVDSLPGTPVTIAFQNGLDPATAVVGSDEQTSQKFRNALFKTILNGKYVSVKHPAKVGGRVMESSFEGGFLSLEGGGVRFDTDEGPVTIDTTNVIDFSRETRSVGGIEQSVIVVKHASDGQSMTTIAATESNHALTLLGRYLQRRYRELVSSLQNIELTEQETRALTTMYSVSETDVSVRFVLDADPDRVKQILHSLHRKGLIESDDGTPVLTARGQVVVNEYLERVN